MALIPDELYKQIVESVSIVCVDIVLKYGDKYILVRRKNAPLKGKWWLVGGRQWKNESLIETAKRKIHDETGLVPSTLKMIGVYEDFYGGSEWGVPTHSVSIVFEAYTRVFKPTLDDTSSAIRLFDKLPNRFIKHYEKIN